MNGSAGGGGASAGGGGGGGGAEGSGAGGVGSGDEAEMPAVHEIGEELIWTGRCPLHARQRACSLEPSLPPVLLAILPLLCAAPSRDGVLPLQSSRTLAKLLLGLEKSCVG